MRLVIALAAACLAAGCQQAAKSPAAADTSDEATALDQLEASQIAGISGKDAVKASAVYADDAVFIGDNGSATTGKKGIDEVFAALSKDPNLKIDYQPGKKIVSADGTMAYATATYTETYTDTASNKPITVKGTNLSVWRKQADGSWMLVADSNPGSIVN